MQRKKFRLTIYITTTALILTFISTSLLGGTLAKYVSSINATEEARTAQWGVDFTATGVLFSPGYQNDDGVYTVVGRDIHGNFENVVAPGTSGLIYDIKATGVPEVAFKVEFDVGASEAANWDYPLGGGLFYEPVIWTLRNKGVIIKQGSFQDILDAIDLLEFTYFPSDSPIDMGISMSWEWPFEGNDEGDTYYGNKFLYGTDVPTFYCELTITATQID